MYSILIAVALLGAPPSEAKKDTTKALLTDLDNDSFYIRERASGKLIERIKEDKVAWEEVLEASKNPISAEQKFRLRRIKYMFFHQATQQCAVPIWSLPKKVRYVGDKDIALEYYKKAQQKYRGIYRDSHIYNHSQIMRYAMIMFAEDWLREFKGRGKLEKLAKQTGENWNEEQLRGEEYCEYYYYDTIKITEVPSSYEDRKKAWNDDEDREEYPYYDGTNTPPDHLVIDHDFYEN